MKGTRTGHRIFVIIAAVAAMLLVLPMSVFCISLDAYKARVDAALLRAFELERILRLGEIDDPRKMLFIAPTRSEFPAAERIEWAGGSVETSHEWLLARVNELESASDVETSLPIIVGIREHLSAIAVVVRDQLVRRVSDLRGLASDDERGHRENDESGSCGSSPTLPVDCCHRQASS